MDYADLKAMFDYEPETGRFVWKSRDNIHASWNTKYAGRQAGSLDAYGYWVLRINSKTYKAHRIAWCLATGSMPPPNVEIDHINGDRLDNRITNLRLANDQQNAANAGMRCDNRSGAKGVSWHRRREKWQAQINDRGKRRSLGYFDSVEAASAAYQKRAVEVYGQFARAA